MTTTPRPDSRLGTDLGPYRIERVLGRGGMGVVYLAEQRELGRKVALKLLPDELAQDTDFRARFERESRLAAAIDHPNVIPLYEAGEIDGTLYLAMRYVEGTDLATRLREGSLPMPLAVEILGQVAGALDAAHEKGLVHRDVKPGNVLLDRTGSDERPHAYLTDFGLTKQAGSETGLTRAGAFLGTPAYMAPEQVDGTEVDGRADQYALGAMAFECLTGRVPFVRDKEVAVALAHLKDPVPSAVALRPELPPAVDTVLGTVMAKDREARYPTCAAFVDDLRAALGGGAVSARPVHPPRRRRPLVLVAAIIGLALVAIAGLTVASGLVGGGSGTGASPSGSAAVTSPSASPGVAADDFPGRAEAALLAKLPAELRDQCVRAESATVDGATGDALAHIRCTAGNVVFDATQLGQDGVTPADMVGKVARDRGVPDGDCETASPAIGPWNLGPTRLGTVVCYQDGIDSVYAWTLDDEALLLRVSVPAGEVKAMRDLWTDYRDEVGGDSLVVANFVALTAGGDVSFGESLVISSAVSPGDVIAATGQLQVDGTAYGGAMSLSVAGQTTNGDVVDTGSERWRRTEGGSWKGPSSSGGASSTINPFLGVTVDDVSYLGLVTDGGKVLYRLEATDAVPLDLSVVLPDVVDPTAESYTVTFNVLRDGTPVTGRAELPPPFASGTLDGKAVQIESYTDWTFTDFGQPVTITPPR